MPTRMLRDGILHSDRVDKLTAEAEVFYRRLMSVVDDFGRFDGRLSMLIAMCYPLRARDMDEDEVALWITLCVDAGLLLSYVASGKPYVQMLDFNQRLRQRTQKYPPPPSPETGSAGICPQVAATGGTLRPVVDVDVDVDVDVKPSANAGALASRKPKKARSRTGKPPKLPKADLELPPGSKAWEAYRVAYAKRYGAEPVRNGTVNAQLAQLVKRLGATEAPDVAAFYVSLNEPFYVKKMHSVGQLLADCEKIRTEWATGRTAADAAKVTVQHWFSTEEGVMKFAQQHGYPRQKGEHWITWMQRIKVIEARKVNGNAS